MSVVMSRRLFLTTSFASATAIGLASRLSAASKAHKCQISLHELSLQRSLLAGRITHLDLARTARAQFELSAIEYASRFFSDRGHDEKYLSEMNKRAAEHEVRQLLISVDGEGRLGAPDPKQRREAVSNHRCWIDAAENLGCHSIEVGISSAGTPEEQLGRVADGVSMLCDHAERHHINILAGCREGQPVETGWLLDLIAKVDRAAFGVLPSFALLAATKTEEELARLLAYTKGVSAASQKFDTEGRETDIDFFSVMSAIQNSGYGGYVGIDYRGTEMGEIEGIRATIALLQAAQEKAV